MLTKLLDLSRIEAGLEPDFQMLDVRQLVKPLASTRADAAAKRERACRSSFTEPRAATFCTRRRGRLAQVFDNLLENAIKFSPAGGEVGVRAQPGFRRVSDRVLPEQWQCVRRAGLAEAHAARDCCR